jgi:NTE family protein
LTSGGDQNIRLQLGGNVATSGLSNFYLGAGFDHLNYLLVNHTSALSIGQFYKSFQYKLRLKFPVGFQFYAQPFFSYNGWDFLNTGNFLDNRRVLPINQWDRSYGINFGIPVFEKMKLELESGLLRKVNEYSNRENYISTDTLDYNRFYGFHHELSLSYSDLNKKLFPTKGTRIKFSISHNYGNETYRPGSTSDLESDTKTHNWLQFSGYYEKYFPLNFGDLGFSLTGKASTTRSFSNLTGTLLNSPSYAPTFESPGVYLENFRSPLFLAGGIKYQLKIYKDFNFRLEGHAFKPLIEWRENENEIRKSSLIPDYYFSGMGALFYSSPIGPISLSAHYYDDKSPFLVLFNIGYLMFNKKPLE